MTTPESFAPGYRLTDGNQLNFRIANPQWSTTASVSATTGGTLTTSKKIVNAVTNITGASVPGAGMTLPQAIQGTVLLVTNNSPNDVRIFADGDSTINGLTGVIGILLPKGTTGIFVATETKEWTQLNTTGNLGITTVPSIAVLKGYPANGLSVMLVEGYYTPGDGGGGYFYAAPLAAPGTYTDNGGTIILPTGGDGSTAWLRSKAPSVDVKQFGAKGDGVSNDSPKIQAAIDALKVLDGGILTFPEGTFIVDLPIVLHAGVSLIGSGVDSTIFKKTTATPSTIYNGSSPVFLKGGQVGYPICILHIVQGSGTNSSSGRVEGIEFLGGTDPNTSNVTYGIFTYGMTNSVITDCRVQNVQYGIVQSGDSLVLSQVINTRINRVWGGFYTGLATGLMTDGLYVSNFRFFGHFYTNCLYSHIANVVAEGGGNRTLFSDTDDEADYYVNNIGGPVAYFFSGCIGSTFKVGSELHSGTGMYMRGNQSCAFENSHFLALTTDYTGSKRVVAAYFIDNFDIRFAGNRFVFTDPAYTNTPDVYNWVTDSYFGRFEYENNRYLNPTPPGAESTSTAETGQGWIVTSGGSGSAGVNPFAFTPDFTFAVPGDLAKTPGTSNIASYYRVGNTVYFTIFIEYYLTFTTASGGFVITGLPFPCGNTTGSATVSYTNEHITWSAGITQLGATVDANTSQITINQIKSATASSALGAGNFTSGTTFRIVLSGLYMMNQ